MKAWFGALSLALAVPAAAQAPQPLFSASDPIHITIQAPVGNLARNRDNPAPIAGTLTDPAGQPLPVTLGLRGITRRSADICDFPPLRVTFTTPPPAASLFAHQKRLKLVTHCRNAAGFQQYVLLEYAAYRMFNVLSPLGLRARLGTFDYVEQNGRTVASKAGFFLVFGRRIVLLIILFALHSVNHNGRLVVGSSFSRNQLVLATASR